MNLKSRRTAFCIYVFVSIFHGSFLYSNVGGNGIRFTKVLKDKQLELAESDPGNTIILRGLQLAHCLGQCLYILHCHSVNINSAEKLCEINYNVTISQTNIEKYLVSKAGWLYYGDPETPVYYDYTDIYSTPSPDSHRHSKKVGCFNFNAQIFSEMLANNRDPTVSVFLGDKLDWQNYEKSLKILVSACEQKAIEGSYKYYGTVYYGICYGAKDAVEAASFLSTLSEKSLDCQNFLFETCNDESALECTGNERTMYVYVVE